MRVAEDGRCSEVDAGLAVGAWATWYHHPSLREDLFDGTLDLTRLGEILQLAGLDAPWEELRER